MHPILSKRIVIFIISLSIIFSQVSWWVLASWGKVDRYIRPEIQITLAQGRTVTISSLPAAIILPLTTYFPFWLVTFSLIHLFRNLEKNRKHDLLHA